VRRGRKPVARIVAIPESKAVVRRKPGAMREDFDEWPPDIARTLGIID
jgi:hypothetical protein